MAHGIGAILAIAGMLAVGITAPPTEAEAQDRCGHSPRQRHRIHRAARRKLEASRNDTRRIMRSCSAVERSRSGPGASQAPTAPGAIAPGRESVAPPGPRELSIETSSAGPWAPTSSERRGAGADTESPTTPTRRSTETSPPRLRSSAGAITARSPRGTTGSRTTGYRRGTHVSWSQGHFSVCILKVGCYNNPVPSVRIQGIYGGRAKVEVRK
jgi:hypothetical protein